MPFKIFRGTLFHKPVTGQEPFFAFSYNKPALVATCVRVNSRYEVQFSMPCFRHMTFFFLLHTRKDYQLPWSVDHTEKYVFV